MSTRNLSLSPELSSWLRNPVIKVSLEPSDRIQELESQVEELTLERDRLLGLYTRECDASMMLADILRQHGIKWR